MATSNTNSAASSDSVFPQLSSNFLEKIRTNTSTFTDIVNQYRSDKADASDDQPLAPVVDLVNAVYGSDSPFLNGNASASSGNDIVTGSGSVLSGSSPVTDSSSVFPLRSEIWKQVKADILSSDNLANQNSGVGSQLPLSSTEVLQLFANDITTLSQAIDSLNSGNNAIASTTPPIV
ncbi:MAG: hypothetical protein KME49_23780 [Brasilonema octagenarum HA4186-MV1]|jgi:hypothetical protein|uniref:Uncharacterized protein n=1 Tax=Brasilonema octagenarum UFV-OR1 TaxID=417115 RepID=A0ABX1M1C0_9CYAN|nr:hypothetical protein [Brasilonema octagenarum]MBW4628449.1 hypothetical protein [Brasilonema octagenarum HA4186-MV1]NMF61446.1 hypothetical protein [Brasilonema octagenarum UFV-OR1]